MSVFEIIMLLCFGSAWPFSIYKSWTSGTNEGKSLWFMVIVLVGYLSGVIHKILHNLDPVVYLYAVNGMMVLVDIAFYFRNRRAKEKGGALFRIGG
jgi:membrane protein DedA with SNARE-associated domain